MTIKRSFEILELRQGASEEDARQAYKDIVNVWHPDRFSANPRLKNKAEQKLKEINVAYETVKAYFRQNESPENNIIPEKDKTEEAFRQSKTRTHRQSDEGRSRTEIAAEVGTTLVLEFCSYVSHKLHCFVKKERC